MEEETLSQCGKLSPEPESEEAEKEEEGAEERNSLQEKCKCSSSCKQIISDATSPDSTARDHAARNGGRYVQLKVRHFDLFPFKCCLEHKIELNSKEIAENKWCAKCQIIFKSVQRFAKKKQGLLLDTKIAPKMRFRCQRGHTFEHRPAE